MGKTPSLLSSYLASLLLCGVSHAENTSKNLESNHLNIDKPNVERLLLLDPKALGPLDLDNILEINLTHMDRDGALSGANKSAIPAKSSNIDLYIWRNSENVVSLNTDRLSGHAITLNVTARSFGTDGRNKICVSHEEAKTLALKAGWEILDGDQSILSRKKLGYTVSLRFDHKCLSVINFVYGTSFPIP